MASIDTNAQLLRQALLRAFFMNMERGRTGKLDPSTGAPYPNPAVDLPANKIWVRVGATTRTDAGRELRVVKNLNAVTTLSTDKPVLIWRNFDGEWEVFGLDPTYADRELGGAIAAAQGDGPPVEVNKTLISRRNIIDFRPRLGDSGGLQMYVAPGRYRGKAWDGGNINLAPYVTATAGKQAVVVVGFDEDTGALVAATGNDIDASDDTHPDSEITDVLATSTFDNARPIAAVWLDNGATAFTNSEIIDLRDLTAVGEAGSGTGTDSTAIHDNVAGEINALTEKADPHDDDELLIEDSEDSYNKKKIKISRLAVSTSIEEIGGVEIIGTPEHGDVLVYESPEGYNYSGSAITEGNSGNFRSSISYNDRGCSITCNIGPIQPQSVIINARHAGTYRCNVYDSSGTVLLYTSDDVVTDSENENLEIPFSTKFEHAQGVTYRYRIQRLEGSLNVYTYPSASYSTTHLTFIDSDRSDHILFAIRLKFIVAVSDAAIVWRPRATVSTAAVSSPPTDAELDAEFGEPADVGPGFTAIVDDGGAGSTFYLVTTDGTNWLYTSLTKAT